MVSLPQQFYFSIFSYRLGLLRYLLLDFCLFFSTHKHTQEVFPQKTVYTLSFTIRNRNPSKEKRLDLRVEISWWVLFLTNPKKIF